MNTKNDKFVEKARRVHGDQYVYTNVDYKNSTTKINIVCPKHGEFSQTPEKHLYYKQGCPLCGRERARLKIAASKDCFIQKATDVHGLMYDYSLVVYKNTHTKVDILCPTHGVFSQTPNNHISKQSKCPQCDSEQKSKAWRKDASVFINQASAIHDNKYDYSLVNYKNSTTKVAILCPKHGVFNQTPAAHLNLKNGCPVCAKSGFSNMCIEWLNSIMREHNIHIQHAYNGGEYTIPGTKIRVDGYCKESNTVYEFHGDKWHGNLDVCAPNEKCHPYNKQLTAKQLHDTTTARECVIKDQGYNLVVMWEHDFKKGQYEHK